MASFAPAQAKVEAGVVAKADQHILKDVPRDLTHPRLSLPCHSLCLLGWGWIEATIQAGTID